MGYLVGRQFKGSGADVIHKETTGLPAYKSTLSGKGVGSDGRFYPSIAGPGKHIITFSFTTNQYCTFSTTTTINVSALPYVSLPNNLKIRSGESVQLKSETGNSKLTYRWTPEVGLNDANIASPIATPFEDITYTLTVSNGFCFNTAFVSINVLKPLIIHNTMTPNGDGINDIFYISNLDNYPQATVDIFDRYGSKIYGTIAKGTPWDGTYSGKPVPAGVYYYVINLKDGKKVYSGYITVIR